MSDGATPPTNRPMTGEDVKLLKAGDVLKIVDADTFLTARGLKNGSLVTLRSLDGQWIDLADLPYPQGTSPYRFQFVSRPAPEPERDGAVERPLKERLVARHQLIRLPQGEVFDGDPINPDGPEALARIERLEGALREIANLCPATCETGPAHSMADIARAALGETQ